MELIVNKENVSINDIIFDGVQELPIESDFMLPDYCPDILRILKCSLDPVITSRQVTGEKIIIDGTAVLKVLYISDAEVISTYEHKLPFSKTISVKNMSENSIVMVNPTTDYVNCRAVSQRRLDIRSVISISVKVISQHGENIVCDAKGKNIQLKKKNTKNSVISDSINKQFTIREELELSSSKPKIARIINKTVCAKMTECKIIANKVIIKGELFICLLYVQEGTNNGLCKCEFSLPISQVFDVDGINEDCKAKVCLQVSDCNVELRPDLDQDGSAIDVEVTVGANINVYCNSNISTVGDVYSTEYESSYQTKPVTVNNLVDIIQEQYTERNKFDLPDSNTDEIYDVWCEIKPRNVQFGNNEMLISGLIKISMLTKSKDGKIQYYERAVDSEYKRKLDNTTDSMTADCDLNIVSCGFALGIDDSVEIVCDVEVVASVFSVSRENIITEIEIDEENGKKNLNFPALTLYYADQNESIWEIAKKYNTSVTAILEQNDILEEILSSRQMLLIPVQ